MKMNVNRPINIDETAAQLALLTIAKTMNVHETTTHSERLTSRRNFFGLLAAGTAGGLTLGTPMTAEASPAVVTGVLYIGQMKSMAVAFLRGVAEVSSFVAEKLDGLTMSIYGANFAPVSPDGNKFHKQHACKYGVERSIDILENIQVDAQGNGIAFRKKDVPCFLGPACGNGALSDFNLSELAFAKFMSEKRKEAFTRLIPISQRLDFSKLSESPNKLTHAGLNVKMIEDRVTKELSPETAKMLDDHFELIYVREMVSQRGKPSIFGLCYLHSKSRKQVFWTFGDPTATEKDRSPLLTQHISSSFDKIS